MTGKPKSRRERIAERTGEATDADMIVGQEDELLWAYYRTLEVSQREAVEMVEPSADVSQSTASRAIRQMDDEMHDGNHRTLTRGIAEEDREMYSEAWLEAYRDVLATAIVELEALGLIADAETETPPWAKATFPELVGEGARFGRRLGLPEELIVEEAPPADSDAMNTPLEADD
jgi:hypothetical protein